MMLLLFYMVLEVVGGPSTYSQETFGNEKLQAPLTTIGLVDVMELDFNGEISQENLDLDKRILHCPPGSTVQKTTHHNETVHLYTNYVVKTGLFSFVITTGLLANFFVLSVLQYLDFSPMKVGLRAEAAAICVYLTLLIPLYPVAHSYPHTGHFRQYEIAKPYITTFFQAALSVTEFLMIWTFVWLSRIRTVFMVLPSKKEEKEAEEDFMKSKAQTYVPKSARDELRLMVVLAVIVYLPRFFDTEIKIENDPCNPGETVVLRVPNIFGRHVVYVLMYRFGGLSLCHYIIPFLYLAYLTYRTHQALRPAQLPAGDTKEKVMRERSKTKDSLCYELDWRILFFYVLFLPQGFFSIAQFMQYLLPKADESYFELELGAELATRLMVTLHAAYIPILTYMIVYEPFRQKAKEIYWDNMLNLYNKFQRRKQQKKDFQALEERLQREEKEPKQVENGKPAAFQQRF